MKKTTIKLALVACCFALTSAHATTFAEYKAEKGRIAADYKAAREKCKSLAGQDKDVCVTEAKTKAKKAKAATEADYRGAPRARKDTTVDSIEADYKVAKQRCEALTYAEDCIAEASNAKAKALADLKTR